MFKKGKLKGVSNPFKSSKSTESNKDDSAKAPKPKNIGPGNPMLAPTSTMKKFTSSNPLNRLFTTEVVARYGFNGKVVKVAYDQTQSLMALATDMGEIHVCGRQQVEVVFSPPERITEKISIKEMAFVKGIYLVIIDSKDTLVVISLHNKKILASTYLPVKVSCMETDPTLDWVVIGLESGGIMIYDVDRDQMSDIRIENLQKGKFFPREKLSRVVSIQWNPRDIGTLLISYELVTVIYSFLEDDVKQSFIYELEEYAPGGNLSMDYTKRRRPKVIQSLYHPNSLHILTVHEDNSMVFWDANTGKLIQARTLLDVDVNVPQPDLTKARLEQPERIKTVKWICQNNPEYTSLLITQIPLDKQPQHQSLTIIDLGGTPLYTITSYDKMSNYYSNMTSQKLVPLPNKTPIVDVVPIARKSPFYAGCHDPAVVLLVLDDGCLETILYPSGSFTYKASLFPQSLSWARPETTAMVATSVPQKLWLVHEYRSALATGHANGSVRLWDASFGELDDNSVFEVNLARVLNMGSNLSISDISFATDTLELSVATETGVVALFKFEVNQFYDPEHKNKDRDMEMRFRRFSIGSSKEMLIDVRDRSPETVRQGFMPSTVVNAQHGPTSALTNSNIGFVAIAYEDGTFVVVDRRGPAIIYMQNVRGLPGIKGRKFTAIEFAIMEYGDDGYSSILILCGTDVGELVTLKILPDSGGRFVVEFVEIKQTNDKSPILKIDTFEKKTTESCFATISKMQDLGKGVVINGMVVVTSETDIRFVDPGKSKEGHKSFKHKIATSGISHITFINAVGQKQSLCVLIVLESNGTVKIFTTPDMKELKSMQLPFPIQAQYIRESSVLRNGDIMTRTGKFQSYLFSTFDQRAIGLNKAYTQEQVEKQDTLYNPGLKIPWRPQVNSLQLARGTSYCTREQLKKTQSKYEESELYKSPGSAGRNSGYEYFRSMSRAVENQWDAVEDGINEYATAIGQAMNDTVEETSKDMVRGAFGF
ncbi:Lethal giant larvae(Lgl) like, C-terminal [Nakaseomyces glabratus]